MPAGSLFGTCWTPVSTPRTAKLALDIWSWVHQRAFQRGLWLNARCVREEDVFRYYGTFSRTFLTMFEILFANWGPPCRVLVENFSEWFSVFFLTYRPPAGPVALQIDSQIEAFEA